MASMEPQQNLQLVANEQPPQPAAAQEQPLQQQGTAVEAAPAPSTRKKGKREASGALRKHPSAPKRFKSSYICFFMAKQNEIKKELGAHATVAAVSKRSAEMWKSLPTVERAHWDELAAKDKQRYLVEKASYSGPWQVPWKRARKDPSAPKRPMSAFLYYSQGRRAEVKKANPTLKNTEVSRLLGEMWRNAPDEERRPHIEKEKEEREKYKVAIAEWRKEHKEKQEAQRAQQLEQASLAASTMAATGGQQAAHQVAYGEQPYGNAPQMAAHPYAMFPPGYGYPPPPPNFYQYPTNGKQPVVLGPSGTPFYPAQPSTYAQGAQVPGAAATAGPAAAAVVDEQYQATQQFADAPEGEGQQQQYGYTAAETQGTE